MGYLLSFLFLGLIYFPQSTHRHSCLLSQMRVENTYCYYYYSRPPNVVILSGQSACDVVSCSSLEKSGNQEARNERSPDICPERHLLLSFMSLLLWKRKSPVRTLTRPQERERDMVNKERVSRQTDCLPDNNNNNNQSFDQKRSTSKISCRSQRPEKIHDPFSWKRCCGLYNSLPLFIFMSCYFSSRLVLSSQHLLSQKLFIASLKCCCSSNLLILSLFLTIRPLSPRKISAS